MEAKREQVFVGLFVIVAAALLIFTVFTLSGALAGATSTYHAKFPNAAGLEPGASVHYAGGPKIGRVEKIQIDPRDSSLMDLTFSVAKELPVKTDSHAKIMSYSPLGDSHLEIVPGSEGAPRAPSGSQLQADPYVDFNQLTAQFNKLAPQAQELLSNLNQRVKDLNVTISRINDLLNEENRKNISGSMAELHGMLAENRPQIRSSLKNVNAATEKINPLIEQLRKAIDQADGTLKKVDGMLGDNREDIRASIKKLRESLNTISLLTNHLDGTLDSNSDNIDEILGNLRDVTENLVEFTDTIKTHPSMLLRSPGPREHQPGAKP